MLSMPRFLCSCDFKSCLSPIVNFILCSSACCYAIYRLNCKTSFFVIAKNYTDILMTTIYLTWHPNERISGNLLIFKFRYNTKDITDVKTFYRCYFNSHDCIWEKLIFSGSSGCRALHFHVHRTWLSMVACNYKSVIYNTSVVGNLPTVKCQIIF